MQDVKKIMVVSTSTSTCKKGIHYGVMLAKTLGAKLYVFHSEYDPFDLEGWGLPIPSLKALREDYLNALQNDRRVLDSMVEQEASPGMEVSITVSDEPLVAEVEKMIKKEKIDLMIMVSYEEGRLEHYLFNGSMHELVRKMPCSVMLVKERHTWE